MLIKNPHLRSGQKQVVIIGGGFAGLNAAKEFRGRDDVQVVLIDQRNYHLFQPPLYQVATAGLNPSDIAVPIRGIFTDDENISVHLGRVESIHLKDKLVIAKEGELAYDYLILACGVRHSYFGKPEWENNAPGLKTLEQATEIRRRILSAFELAENEPDPERQKALLTFVIVGAGPTGVELAGTLACRVHRAHRATFLHPAGPSGVVTEENEPTSAEVTASTERMIHGSVTPAGARRPLIAALIADPPASAWRGC